MAENVTTESQKTDEQPPVKRILLVDDDAEIIEAMRYALEAKGYQILVARDGNQAWRWPNARTRIW